MTRDERPYMTSQEAKQFTKDFSELTTLLIAKLQHANTIEEAQVALSMMEDFAQYELPQAKTLYGMMLLMEGKPWYDVKKALDWLKKGAQEAAASKEHPAADSMYQYGLILLDGLYGVPCDPITGKYWIDKAAELGFKAAIKEQRKRW